MIEKRTQKKIHNRSDHARLGTFPVCARRRSRTRTRCETQHVDSRRAYVSFLIRDERRDSLRAAVLR
jgi:hypothetical protein